MLTCYCIPQIFDLFVYNSIKYDNVFNLFTIMQSVRYVISVISVMTKYSRSTE